MQLVFLRMRRPAERQGQDADKRGAEIAKCGRENGHAKYPFGPACLTGAAQAFVQHPPPSQCRRVNMEWLEYPRVLHALGQARLAEAFSSARLPISASIVSGSTLSNNDSTSRSFSFA